MITEIMRNSRIIVDQVDAIENSCGLDDMQVFESNISSI